MTLLEEIQAGGFDLQNRDDGAIAAALSVGRTKVASHIGGVGTVMNALGPEGGAALLDNLEAMAATVPAVKWAFVMINAGTLDFGLDSTRGMIAQLVPSPAKEALLAIAEVPDHVSAQQVAQALEGL